MKIGKGFTLQSENPKTLSNIDLNKIQEIEQDMWAESIGEYIKCSCCDIIFSKKDIFGHLNKNIYQETVLSIQKILELKSIKCKKCHSDTNFIWGLDYLDEIKNRYKGDNTFLTTIRKNNTGEIIGFTDGYISDFDTIYKREFQYYYNNIGQDKLKTIIKDTLLGEFPEYFLIQPVVAINVKYSSIEIFLALIKQFYLNLYKLGYGNITGIYEAHIGDIAHSLYHVFGGERIYTNNTGGIINNRQRDNISDILIHKNIIHTTLDSLSCTYREFIKQNSKKMKEVLIR